MLLVIIIGTTSFKTAHQKIEDNPQTFSVYFEQDGNKIDIINNEVKLKRALFSIILVFPQPMGLLINGSFNDSTYHFALKNLPMDQLPGFRETGMAEDNFNPKKEILIANNAPSYWYYDSKKENRFDNVTEENSKLICEREIKTLDNVDTKKNSKVSDCKNPLYLVFISYAQGKDWGDRIEVERIAAKINWQQ